MELVVVLLILVVIFMFSSCSLQCNSPENYRGGGYYNACEYNESCLWDTARWCTMSDNTEGNCTLHGKCCPAFSKDHSRAQEWGLRPSDVQFRSLQWAF